MEIIKHLPDDIIRYIIPFTYKLQNKDLMFEIRIYTFFCYLMNNERQKDKTFFNECTNMQVYLDFQI